jgi:hypothetical protein
MRRIFWGFCRNWFLIDPLHYLSSCFNFGFEIAEIFLIEKRLSDLASWGVADSLTRLLNVSKKTRRVGEFATPRLVKLGSRKLCDSASQGVANQIF